MILETNNTHYIFVDIGNCIDKATCPKPNICGKNEEYKDNGENCTCVNSGMLECELTEQAGCYCLPGFYRNARGICIKKTTCTSCPLNASYRRRGEVCVCNQLTGLSCEESTVKQCYCKYGYYMNGNQECIPKDTCLPQPVCSEDREYQEIGKSCVCNENKLTCEPNETPNCYCREGFYENKYGKCVPESRCTGKTCDEGTYYFNYK